MLFGLQWWEGGERSGNSRPSLEAAKTDCGPAEGGGSDGPLVVQLRLSGAHCGVFCMFPAFLQYIMAFPPRISTICNHSALKKGLDKDEDSAR